MGSQQALTLLETKRMGFDGVNRERSFGISFCRGGRRCNIGTGREEGHRQKKTMGQESEGGVPGGLARFMTGNLGTLPEESVRYYLRTWSAPREIGESSGCPTPRAFILPVQASMMD